MVYNTRNHCAYGLRPLSGILNDLNTQRFKTCISFRLQVKGKETNTLLGPLQRANFNDLSNDSELENTVFVIHIFHQSTTVT
jgi:hypothetical protein